MFVELTDIGGNKFLLNKNKIQNVYDYESFRCLETEIYNMGEFFQVKETYEEIKKLLK